MWWVRPYHAKCVALGNVMTMHSTSNMHHVEPQLPERHLAIPSMTEGVDPDPLLGSFSNKGP